MHKSSVLIVQWLSSLVCVGVFINYQGFSLSSLGLSLPTFANNLQVSIDEVSSLVIARGCGYLLGSLACGILSKYFQVYSLLIFALSLMCIGLTFTPVTLNVIGLFVLTFITGSGSSAFETIGNVAVLQIWGERSEPFIQLLHFCFCVGAAVMPFIIAPFLDEANSVGANIGEQNFTSNNYSGVSLINRVGNSAVPLISIPYFIMGFVVLSIIVFVLAIVPVSFLKKMSSKQKNTVGNEGTRFRFVMLVLLFLFYFSYVGFGVTFLTYLFTFGLSDAPGMKLSKQRSVYLTTVCFFSIVFGQFFAIFMSKKFSPSVILVVDLTGMVVAAVLMGCLPFYGNTAPLLFWIAISITGVFSASIYGTTFLWAERYITVNARAASVFIIGGSAGEMVLPLLVGLLIEKHPLSFLYLNISYTFIIVIFFVVMWKVANTKGERLKNLKSCEENLKFET